MYFVFMINSRRKSLQDVNLPNASEKATFRQMQECAMQRPQAAMRRDLAGWDFRTRGGCGRAIASGAGVTCGYAPPVSGVIVISSDLRRWQARARFRAMLGGVVLAASGAT